MSASDPKRTFVLVMTGSFEIVPIRHEAAEEA